MKIQPKQPTAKGPADLFTGDVWFDVIAKGEEASRIRVNTVRFSPGARTAWHAHAVGQTLHITEGRGLVQARGGEIVGIQPGDTIYAPPGEWHWHGAAPDHFMTHIAMWEAPAEGAESDWGAHVTEARVPRGGMRLGAMLRAHPAANAYVGFFEEASPEQVRAQMETNLFGPMNVTRAALPVMRQQRSGLVVAIWSTAASQAASSPPPTPRPSSPSRDKSSP